MCNKNLTLTWVLVALAGLFLQLPAREYKVGYINSDQLIARYEGAIEAKKQLNEAIAKFQARAESLRVDYEKAKEEYESQQLTLSEEGKRAKLSEVESRKRRYDSYLNEIYGTGGKIEQKNQELIAPIVAQIDSAVRKIAQQEGFSLIIDATKAGIVFAETGLDLTELVLEELNRAYAPLPTPVAGKKIFLITPIYELNDEAQREHLGTRIRQFINALLKDKTQLTLIPDRKVDEVVQNRGYSGQQVGFDQALDVARALDADYCIFGECSKRERKIQFKLSIIDIRTQTLLRTQEGEAERAEILQEKVSAVLQVLYSALEQ
jgi:outer membrane protein|uniref:OmpH family outer membrane protein n=1 Tax=candidate division WOR-3 bacterium TaxID=2052148 RepID=A0A7V3PTL0_UNCW3